MDFKFEQGDTVYFKRDKIRTIVSMPVSPADSFNEEIEYFLYHNEFKAPFLINKLAEEEELVNCRMVLCEKMKNNI